MNLLHLRRKSSHGMVAILVASSVLLASCGGSSGGSSQSAGVGGTGVAVGKTTGFGSIYVNGRKYNTNKSRFLVDGDPGVQDDLAVGMYVLLRVETLDGNFTGKALEVIYDDEVEGPIAAPPVPNLDGTQKTFMVFNQTITIDDIDTLFDGTSFATIDVDDVVEISGFRVSATEIQATYVEKTGDFDPGNTEVELRGDIDQFMGGSTFEIDGTIINFDPTGTNTDIDVPGGVISNGLYVEVKGVIQANLSVDAGNAGKPGKIEAEDEGFGDDVDDIKLQGIVADIASGIDNFLLGSQRVDASGVAGLTLMDGMNIEVEGEIVAGKLIADEVDVEEEETELRSYVETVDTSIIPEFFTMYYQATTGPTTVTVHIDSQTYFEDETGAATPPFSIDDLNQGRLDYVRVEGVEIANDEVLATVVKRTSPENKLELKGVVDGVNLVGGNGTITVLGIQYQLDSIITSYDPDPPDIVVGDFVEIQDDADPSWSNADGIADEVEEE